MMKRIPKQNIVAGGKRVLPAGHPDLIWYDPSEVIIIGEDSEYKVTGSVIPIGINNISGSIIVGAEKSEEEEKKEEEKGKVELADVPQLSDIESVTYTKYFDPVTKVEKAKAVIKIRNSSKNKENVAGVDARIYQPRGA